MCEDHVHADAAPSSEVQRLVIGKSLLSANNAQAADNRARFDASGVLVVNLMSSPGAGKTSLLEATIEALRDEFRMCVIEGDMATENDAVRIRSHGVPAIQILTGAACHLDARMISRAIDTLSLGDFDILFIENVGNLVCPAMFDLGQSCDVALLSIVEGDDKPAKYPVLFRRVDLVILSKQDLSVIVDDFATDRVRACLHAIGSDALSIELSSKSGAGMDRWIDWLRHQRQAHRRLSEAATSDVQ